MASGRATGPGGRRAGQPGRADGFGPSGRAGQPSLQLAVRTGEPTCGSTGTPTGGSIGGSTVPTAKAKFGLPTGGSIAPPTDAKFGPSTVPPTYAKSGPSTGGSTAPITEAKSGPPTDGSIVPTTEAKFVPSTGPSTALQPTQSSALQPLLQPTLPTVMPMHLNRSRRQCNEIPEEQHRQSSKFM